MKEIMKKGLLLATCLMAGMAGATGADAAGVNIYAEGAYDAENLDVFVYADIIDPEDNLRLISNGIKLSYNTEVLVPLTTEQVNPETSTDLRVKKGADWKIGQSSKPVPEVTTNGTTGEVVVIGGKLKDDPELALEGVGGERQVIAEYHFTRQEDVDPGSNPEDYFKIKLSHGRFRDLGPSFPGKSRIR